MSATFLASPAAPRTPALDLPGWSRWQPQLRTAALLSLLALLPVLLALQFDTRTTNDLNVWVKPAKFLLSFAIYYATLAWTHAFLSPAAQRGRVARAIVPTVLVIGAAEMTWLVLAAAQGVPSHFNRALPWSIAYNLAGAGALVLIGAVLAQGVLIARDRAAALAPTLRWALVAGATVCFVATFVTVAPLASGTGHWVGGTPSDAGGLPLFGWSRDGGDLRVAHFFALHAQQVLPLAGVLLAAAGWRNARGAVVAVSAAYVALIAFTLLQALAGRPFLPFVG